MADKQDKIVECFFIHIVRIKMYHFQTKKYGAHKAADNYLNLFQANFDRFMEVSQGIYGQVRNTKMDLKIGMVDDKSIVNELNSFIDMLRNFSSMMNNNLLVIKDEMVADAEQFKYLLMFG